MKRNDIVAAAFAASAFVLAGAFAFAVDVPPVSAADFGGEPADAHWIWTLVGSGAFAAIVAAFGKIVQSIIGSIRDARIARACEFVYAGTITCYQEYVRAMKAAHADGKLTAGEKDEALQCASRKAIEIARTQGVDLLKVLGKDLILSLIEKYAGESKAASLAKAVAGPLSASRQPVPEPPLPASAY